MSDNIKAHLDYWRKIGEINHLGPHMTQMNGEFPVVEQAVHNSPPPLDDVGGADPALFDEHDPHDPYRGINPKDEMVQVARKVELGLLPPAAKHEIAKVHMYGAYDAPRADGGKGYGPYNWREVEVRLSIYLDAIERHLDAIRRGEWLDPDSGYSHLAHIGASINIALDAHFVGTLIYDLRTEDPV